MESYKLVDKPVPLQLYLTWSNEENYNVGFLNWAGSWLRTGDLNSIYMDEPTSVWELPKPIQHQPIKDDKMTRFLLTDTCEILGLHPESTWDDCINACYRSYPPVVTALVNLMQNFRTKSETIKEQPAPDQRAKALGVFTKAFCGQGSYHEFEPTRLFEFTLEQERIIRQALSQDQP